MYVEKIVRDDQKYATKEKRENKWPLSGVMAAAWRPRINLAAWRRGRMAASLKRAGCHGGWRKRRGNLHRKIISAVSWRFQWLAGG